MKRLLILFAGIALGAATPKPLPGTLAAELQAATHQLVMVQRHIATLQAQAATFCTAAGQGFDATTNECVAK